MHPSFHKVATALGVAALALPGAALARGGSGHGHGHGSAAHGSSAGPQGRGLGRGRNLVLRGTLTADPSGTSVTVHVAGGNHAARLLYAGQDVTVDVSAARITVADVNRDGRRDLADVHAGDRVVVQIRRPRGFDPAAPLSARHMVDQGGPTATQDATDTEQDGDAPPPTSPTAPAGDSPDPGAPTA